MDKSAAVGTLIAAQLLLLHCAPAYCESPQAASSVSPNGNGILIGARNRTIIISRRPAPPVGGGSPFRQIFDFDQSKLWGSAYTYVGPGATPPASTSYTPMPQLAQTVRSYEIEGAGFQNNLNNHTGGRSSAAMDFLRLNHGGQGDAAVSNVLLQVYGNRSGATHFLAQPAVALAYGDVVAATGSGDGKYLQAFELNFRDNGTAAAVGGLTFNYHRTNAGTALKQVWVHDRPQSVGTVPIDAFYAPSGLAKRGLDTSGAALNDALVMAVGQCVRFGATATADATGLKSGATSLGASRACLDTSGYLHVDAGAGKSVILDNLPTAETGLPSGALYKDTNGFLKVAP